MKSAIKTLPCKLVVKKITCKVPLDNLSQVVSQMDSAVILGGNKAVKQTSGFSYWAWQAKEIFEFKSGDQQPFEQLDDILKKYSLAGKQDTLPSGIFCGGWIGYFAYELGRHIEKLPAAAKDDISMPLVWLGFYDKVICFDHHAEQFLLIALEINNSAAQKITQLEDILKKAESVNLPSLTPADMEHIDLSTFRCNMDKAYYIEAVEKIKKHILDGDVYQVNFSQRFDCDFNGSPINLFRWQNNFNPSGYAAYIAGENFHIVSASPEMFITSADGKISTKPIKGTRPRGSDEKLNRQNFDQLLTSQKEQAELNMIIDLERNDLARICLPGTREVTQPRTIEQHPTVFHAVATVAGQLKPDIGFCEILKAMFPGGSITGAPKIRAMEIIDQTEPHARGVYTGSIGFLGQDSTVCLNIAIRTVIIKGEKAFVQVGGGIVADSEPEDEWAETITKAKALLAGIRNVQ